MKILFYILTPILGYIFNLVIGILVPIATIPLTWIIGKIENNNHMYKFRLDMFIQGIIRGVLTVFLLDYFHEYFESGVSFWWIIATIIWSSYLCIIEWKDSNPPEYEFTKN